MKLLPVLLAFGLPLLADVKVTKETDRVTVDIDGKPYTTLFYGPNTKKPYLHPLRTADGKIVTRQFPMEKVEGETRDHPHHEGVWFTHGDVNGLDFWANTKEGPKFGKIVVDKITKAKGGKKSGVIAFDARWVDGSGKALLVEKRTMTFAADDSNRIIDFDIELTAQKEPVKFGDTKEGTFAIRIADTLTEKSKGGVLVSSTGGKTMKNVWGKQAAWVDYSGKLNGEAVGIAIFDHPSNPKHPTYWHARDYGLFAANIFGEHDYYADKSRDGSVTVQPGESLHFRYRVVVHPGETADVKLAEMYEAYKKTK